MTFSDEPLLTAEEIQARVKELAAQISRDYAGKEIALVVVLKGGLVFAADLMRGLTVPMTLSFLRAKSYDGNLSTGRVKFLIRPDEPLAGKHVLLVEDILDSGRTSSAIMDRIIEQVPASLALCTLLDKPAHRIVEVPVAYVGFQIDDHFVIGYGLDYNERYRELSDIHIFDRA